MLIRVGYELIFQVPARDADDPDGQHPLLARARTLSRPDLLTTDPPTRVTAYRDGFGNWCSRIVAPIGRIRLKGSGVVETRLSPM